MTDESITQLVWSGDFAIGYREIDEQHQELFEIYNGALRALRDHPRDLTPAAVLKALVDYTEYHFTTEQAIMASTGYPGRHEHVREHRALLSSVRAMMTRVDEDPNLLSEVVGLLRVWIQGHIRHSDAELGAFLKER